MQVILREELPNLGTIGDVVKVKPGYARNYLLPRGLAIEASGRNLKEVGHQKRVAGDKRLREQKTAAAVADKLGAVMLGFTLRAGEEGKLFGSVTNQDIHRALEERGFTIERRRVLLDEPIKTLGEHKVTIHVGPDTRTTITVSVSPLEE
ncbi:MAG: 50S ribosomal protein L9 [Deltaproteobacteria bacterium]|nr:50S ribosomal protein L9 [Deltaproteobacteria bacterium]